MLRRGGEYSRQEDKGSNAMTKLEGFPNFRVGQEFEVLERFKGRDRGKFANFRFSNF